MRPATAWKYSWPLNNIVTKLLFLDFPPHDYARFHRRAWQRLLVWSHSTGTLENVPSTFRCWPLGITIIFSNNILWAFSICSSFSVSREASSTGVDITCCLSQLDKEFYPFNCWITCVANIFLKIKWSLSAEILLIGIFSVQEIFTDVLCSILLHTWYRPSLIFFLNVL